MQLTTFLQLSLTATTVMARGFILPPNLPDGHYSGDGSIDAATGFAKYTYHGPIQPGHLSPLTEPIAADTADNATARSRIQSRNYGPFCNSRAAPGNIYDAQNAFANYWDNKDFSAQWAKSVLGVAMGYVCNYGGTLTVHKGDYYPEMASVDVACGRENAGWFSNYDNWRLNYGRDDVRNSIC